MIKFFKLNNGEEVVAEIEDGDDDAWREKLELKRPFRNMLTPQGPMLVPYPCDLVSMPVAHVLFSGEANAELVAGYQQATGSIVTLPRTLQLPD